MVKRKLLEEFKDRINKHLSNELDIMHDLLEAKLTSEEWDKITSLIYNHPIARFNRWVENLDKIMKEKEA